MIFKSYFLNYVLPLLHFRYHGFANEIHTYLLSIKRFSFPIRGFVFYVLTSQATIGTCISSKRDCFLSNKYIITISQKRLCPWKLPYSYFLLKCKHEKEKLERKTKTILLHLNSFCIFPRHLFMFAIYIYNEIKNELIRPCFQLTFLSS